MLPLGMPNHTHHEPLWLFSPIEPAKTCWDTLYYNFWVAIFELPDAHVILFLYYDLEKLASNNVERRAF